MSATVIVSKIITSFLIGGFFSRIMGSVVHYTSLGIFRKILKKSRRSKSHWLVSSLIFLERLSCYSMWWKWMGFILLLLWIVSLVCVFSGLQCRVRTWWRIMSQSSRARRPSSAAGWKTTTTPSSSCSTLTDRPSTSETLDVSSTDLSFLRTSVHSRKCHNPPKACIVSLQNILILHTKTASQPHANS